MSNQLSDKLKQELYAEAQNNGFSSKEYLALLDRVDDLLNRMSQSTLEATKGIRPSDYDINGQEI